MTGGTAIVLGSVGRNFAAGMSGGIAYVYDVDGKFNSKCNTEIVDLFPVESDGDVSFLKQYLNEFIQKTGSAVASRILQNWAAERVKFIKVFPKEYQRALEQLSKEKELEEMSNNKENSLPNHDQTNHKVNDIEDSITDDGKLDKIK